MVYFHFSLNFQTQLHITEGELYDSIIASVKNAISKAGGAAHLERHALRARLDDKKPGFALNLTILLEDIRDFMTQKELELYGYVCVVSAINYEWGFVPSGLWVDEMVAALLAPPGCTALASFTSHYDAHSDVGLCPLYAIGKLGLKNVPPSPDVQAFNASLDASLEHSIPAGNCLVISAARGIRTALRRYAVKKMAKKTSTKTAPLTFCFGAGGKGLVAFAEAFTALPVPPSEQLEKDAGKEMAALAELIAAERFRDEASPYLMEKAAQFLDLLLKAYCRSLAGEYGIVLLENLDEAGKDAAKLFCQVWGKLPCKGELCVLAYASEESLARLWAHLFDAVATLPPALSAAKQDPPTRNLHPALLEMARTFSLLRENFPVRQFTGLFEEGGWNPELATRTLKYFQDNGFIECAEDPLPSIKVPPPDEAPIRAFVRERLLKAAKERRFHPCFRLLEVLSKLAPANTHGLEAELGDALVLDAITADINNNTCSAIETSIQQGNFVLIVGKERAACLRYLYETNRALVQGEERDIRRVFSLESDLGTCPEYQSRVLLMQAAYKLSIHETGEALSTVKQALMQAQHSGRDLAVAYRLFSLANVSRGSLNEANEYFNFALDNAAQTRNQEELTISAFYAAAGQYLYGNISLAQRLALRACEAAAKAGRYAWVRRARFLYGRLLFETGLVQDALKIFRELFDLLPDTDEGLKAMPVLEAWIFRCGVYLNLALPRKPEKSSPDYALFCLEAALLSKTGSFSEALAQEALRSIPANDFLFIEQPDWCSGFAQVELLCNSPRAFYTRLIQVFRALSHAKTGAASPGPSPHELINQILRQDSKPRIDPLDSFYYYADYLVLSMTGAGEVDKGTALSMALNRLQTRATRIDDKEVKLNFLHTQRVNLRLWEEARRHKLV